MTAFSKVFFLSVVFVLLASIALCAEQGNSAKGMNDAQNETIKQFIKETNVVQSEAVKQLTTELSSQNQKIQSAIQFLSIAIAVVSLGTALLAALLPYLHNRREQETRKQEMKLVETTLLDSKKHVEDKANDLKEYVDREIGRLKDTVSADLYRGVKEKMDEQMHWYELEVLNRIDEISGKHEERLLKTEIVSREIWDRYSDEMLKAAHKNDLKAFFIDLSHVKKETLALFQMLSPDPQDIWTGINTFIENNKQMRPPASLWDLLILLNEQGRLKDYQVRSAAEDLARLLDKSLRDLIAHR